MKKVIFLLILGATPLLGTASHIVGGEFELKHLADYRYRLTLILYFDSLNGNAGARDTEATARIFRMRDNARMLDVRLFLQYDSAVLYTQPLCSHGELVTRKLIYIQEIVLSPALFDDPQGYYVAWERCCRNYSIANAYSLNPDTNPSTPFYAGQTFYLEFPPVIKNGVPFVDSTPRLFPPLNDFGCPKKPYYKDFGGVDDDGDSLVYSLVTPLSTKTSEAIPSTRPRPYPDIQWRPGYGLTHILNGSPDLHISKDGFLTVTPPAIQGLFVFAVRVEEYRDKVKIGETRRDFQMLVVDQCARAIPPQIVGKKITDATYTYDESMSVSFSNGISDDDRAIKVKVSDEDSKEIYDKKEVVKIKAIALNFKANVSVVLPPTDTAILKGDNAYREFIIKFPECPFIAGMSTYRIGIVAMDDACALPLTDTLKVEVTVVPPPNTKPHFITPPSNPVTASLTEGTSQTWPWSVVDDEADPLVISLLTDGFVLANAGMIFNNAHQVNGAADGTLSWDAFCDIYDFTQRTNFKVTIQVDDQDKCNIPDPAKQVFNLSVVQLPQNSAPVIDTDLTTNPAETKVSVTRKVNESLAFSILANDPDIGVPITMSTAGVGFQLADIGAAMTPSPASGNPPVSAKLNWNITCNSVDLKKKDLYAFQFVVVDSKNKCRFFKTDTVVVEVKILPPDNQAPALTIVNQNSALTTLANNTLSVTRGPSINLLVTGTDGDVSPQDNLKIELVTRGDSKPDGYAFANVTGKSPVSTAFTWTPDCSIFKDGIYENDYLLTFKIADDRCFVPKKDSINIILKVKDIDGSDTEFIPPNFFSPNGDNVNDYFAMELKNESTGEVKNILPNDNCASRFESIRIYNRWGNQVFQSNDRNFRWYGPGESAGVYFYQINFTHREYRGSLSLRY